jgi:Flp pilus assembly protein TadG
MSSAVPYASTGNILRRFHRSRRASAAVEFALVAPMFFGLLFAIIETGVVFFAGQVLETLTQDSARVISTGQSQSGLVTGCATTGCTQAQFQQYVCSQTPTLFNSNNCSGLYIDVESCPSASGFSCVAFNNQIASNGTFINNMQYNPGGPGYIVVVKLFYQWPLFVTSLGYNIANLSGSMRLLTATAVFKNEPY